MSPSPSTEKSAAPRLRELADFVREQPLPPEFTRGKLPEPHDRWQRSALSQETDGSQKITLRFVASDLGKLACKGQTFDPGDFTREHVEERVGAMLLMGLTNSSTRGPYGQVHILASDSELEITAVPGKDSDYLGARLEISFLIPHREANEMEQSIFDYKLPILRIHGILDFIRKEGFAHGHNGAKYQYEMFSAVDLGHDVAGSFEEQRLPVWAMAPELPGPREALREALQIHIPEDRSTPRGRPQLSDQGTTLNLYLDFDLESLSAEIGTSLNRTAFGASEEELWAKADEIRKGYEVGAENLWFPEECGSCYVTLTNVSGNAGDFQPALYFQFAVSGDPSSYEFDRKRDFMVDRLITVLRENVVRGLFQKDYR